MSEALERIEREARERRIYGRNTGESGEPRIMFGSWQRAETAVDELLAIAKDCAIEVRQAVMVGLTDGWSLKPLSQEARANVQLLQERDEARALAARMYDAWCGQCAMDDPSVTAEWEARSWK